MVIGDRKSVVMESDRAVPGGVATLGNDGKLEESQRPDYKIGQVEGLQDALDVKQGKIMERGILKGDGSGNVTSAILGEDYGFPTLKGHGSPNSSAVGAVGQHYLDVDTGMEYVCVAADAETGVYTWKVSGGIMQQIDGQAPTGSIFWYAKETAPEGYLICDGSAVSRTDYARLFEAIGTEFGAGDGEMTFALPDLRAKFVRGAGTSNLYKGTFGETQQATFLLYSNDRIVYTPPSQYDAIQEVSASLYRAPDSVSGASQVTRYFFRPYNIALTPIIKY